MTKDDEVRKNIFGTVLTGVGPASNYRGDSEGGNLTPLQKLRFADGLHTVFSGESIRSNLREMLCSDKFPCNRSRLKDQRQPTVEYKSYPNPWEFADDRLFGFLALNKSKEHKETATKLAKARKDKDQERIQEHEKHLEAFYKYPGFQGDSVLRINYAVSVSIFDDDSTMHQSPNLVGAFSNADSSQLIFREVHVTAYQYPFGLNLNDLLVRDKLTQHAFSYLSEKDKSAFDFTDSRRTQLDEEYEKTKTGLREKYNEWTAVLLRGISELNGVGGNHARTMFSHAPVSIIVRLTTRRTPDFDLYGFKNDATESQRQLLEALEDKLTTGEKEYRLPGREFYIGGELAREHPKLTMRLYSSENEQQALNENIRAVNVFKTPLEAINAVIRDAGLEAK